jgi:hypothetical protein
MPFLFAGTLASLAQPVLLILGAVTGFLFGRRYVNLGWSLAVLVWLGYALYEPLRLSVPLGGIYAYPIIVVGAYLLTRLLSAPTEADGE